MISTQQPAPAGMSPAQLQRYQAMLGRFEQAALEAGSNRMAQYFGYCTIAATRLALPP